MESHTPARRTDWHVTPLGGLRRRGAQPLASRTVVVALIGGAKLDLRDATVPAGGATVVKVSLVGGVDVAVPPGVRVEVSGASVVGGRRVEVPTSPDPGAPVLRIQAYGIFGGVRVHG